MATTLLQALGDPLCRIARIALGVLFVYAGAVKLADPRSFAALMDAYGILPDALLLPVAVALPALEVAAGAGLAFDLRWCLEIVTGLLLLFLAILAYGLWMGLDIDCGCFGPEDPEGRAYHGLGKALARDLGLLGGVLFLHAWRRYRRVRPLSA